MATIHRRGTVGARYAGRKAALVRRQARGRKKISGTSVRPRLVVTRSARHLYAQLVDDTRGVTLAAASSYRLDGEGDKTAQARKVGELLAERGKAAGVSAVVFDRSGNKYHGRVAALAQAARQGGLEF